MEIVDEYADEGKSGKNTTGRPAFRKMMEDIKSGKDSVELVLVFKLSRFGRNAADVLNSLQTMQDYGVNLICVQDGIDSRTEVGKLMISVLSAVSELERENISVQTMSGRIQKAKEGKWNGGFAPYGYNLVDGQLVIAEDEQEVIRIIFDKYVNTSMQIGAIANYLEKHGFKKKIRQNNTRTYFTTHFIKAVLDNPVYCGKIAYGRRKTAKKKGTRNETRIVRQQNYDIYNGIHSPIVSEDLWNAAHKKRTATGTPNIKTHSLEHEHILSGILRCPVCGGPMYGNVNRKKRSDGTYYSDFFYYQCKRGRLENGEKCPYNKQWNQSTINAAVSEVVSSIANNPTFIQLMSKQLNSKINTKSLEKEQEVLNKAIHLKKSAQRRLMDSRDNLDPDAPHFEAKYKDLEQRIDLLYDELSELNNEYTEICDRIESVIKEKISLDNIYKYLKLFNKFYDKFSDIEKKTFMQNLIERIQINEDRSENGQFLKRIDFKIPVYFGNEETKTISWDNETTVETVVALERR